MGGIVVQLSQQSDRYLLPVSMLRELPREKLENPRIGGCYLLTWSFSQDCIGTGEYENDTGLQATHQALQIFVMVSCRFL